VNSHWGMKLLLGCVCSLIMAQAKTAFDPAICLSENPNDWPAAARPYFLVIADTSGSMTTCTNPPSAYPRSCGVSAIPNSCGLTPTRYNDLKCALEKTTSAFSGQARFGLSTFATYISACADAVCASDCTNPLVDCGFETYGCTFNVLPNDTGGSGCGPINGTDPTTREGSILRAPIARDFAGDANQEPSNAQDLLGWVDNYCGGDNELHAAGATPLNGALRDAKRYFETGLTNPVTTVFYPTPLDANDRPCRSVNVILITDGDESCDSQNSAVDAAADLYNNGVDVGGNNFSVRVHVINLAGGTQANTDAIAFAGGTTASLYAEDEVALSQALSDIISDAQGREICDNADNNCNGCFDEGFQHFANVGQSCCAWGNETEREQCLAAYRNSIAVLPPEGDLSLLPCTSFIQQTDQNAWLCHNPGEVCDSLDNNGLLGVDEGTARCGDPLHCPEAETCNGKDDNCDGQVDEGGVCGACVWSREVCDGCDNDCDGIVDNGSFDKVHCGLDAPSNCGEIRSCAPAQSAPAPGACVLKAGYGRCQTLPVTESCDGVDNDCNGVIDDLISPVACVASDTPVGLVYGGESQCQKGQMFCGGACLGFIGPTLDVTDGIDNNCDGIVDNTPTSLIEAIFGDGFEFE